MTAVGTRCDTCHWVTVLLVVQPDRLRSLRRYAWVTLLGCATMSVLLPLLMGLANGTPLPGLLVAVVLAAVPLVVHGRRLRRAVDAPGRVLPWRPSAVTLVVSLCGFAYLYLRADPGNTLWVLVPAVSIAELQFGRPGRAGLRLNLWLTALVAAVVAGLTALPPDPASPPLSAALVTVFGVAGLTFSEVVALWQWRVTLELDQARRDAAELGATRERLRFAEDLHDILGHALEVVSLKSELATRLVPVDPDRASAEMVQVQRLARGAVKDVRDLARGRRPTTLETELTGARSLLASAGIDCVVDGDPAGPHSELFGRVLREAVTNLLRHADTRQCWITVRPATLTVVNDGVGGAPPAGDGTGLAGLRRRVAEAGGELTAGPGERPGTFSVAVVVP